MPDEQTKGTPTKSEGDNGPYAADDIASVERSGLTDDNAETLARDPEGNEWNVHNQCPFCLAPQSAGHAVGCASPFAQ